MNVEPLPRWRFWLVVLVTLGESAHLGWEHFHGGVHAHHFLNRADLPAISNGWGLLLLPALAWFLGGRSQRRIARSGDQGTTSSGLPGSVVAGFAGSLLFGALLAASFEAGHEDATATLFQSLFPLALILPLYRAECVLGFVLGMTFTFGAMLPSLFGGLFAALSAFAHRLLWPWLRRLRARLKRR